MLARTKLADLVNLNRYRKRLKQAESAQEAEANRTRFGRTKSEKRRDEQVARRAREVLNGHLIEDGDKS